MNLNPQPYLMAETMLSNIGSTANITCISESERCGIPEARISPQLWLRKGLVVMFVSLLIASGVFVLFFEFFQ